MSAGPEGRAGPPGLTMVDVLALPDPLGRLCTRLLRDQQLTLAGVVSLLGGDEPYARGALAELLQRGFILETLIDGVVYYRVRFAVKRAQHSPAKLRETPEDK